MKIQKTMETPDGTYSFEGEITQQEHDVLVEAGFRLLFGLGLLPFAMTKLEDQEEMPKEMLN